MTALTRSEAVARVGIGASTLRRWIRNGDLTSADGLIDEAELLAVDRAIRGRRGRPRKHPVASVLTTPPDPDDGVRQTEGTNREPSPGFLPPAAIRARLALVSVAAESLVEGALSVMREAPTELARLTTALFAERAKCTGDARFTADAGTLTAEDLDDMRATCRGCRVRTPCEGYASAADPSAGFWAGTEYPRERLEAVA